jgi:hypothetical protein
MAAANDQSISSALVNSLNLQKPQFDKTSLRPHVCPIVNL